MLPDRRHDFAGPVLSWLLLVFAMVLGPMSAASAQTKARDISIGLQAAISSMDPHYHNVGPNNAMLRHVFESLVAVDENQKFMPGLATSWKPLDDLTWEFKLRKNVRWHDGSPFTADRKSVG